METTSQTPRTDAHQLMEHMAFDHLWSDFARQLETELNEARNQLENLQACAIHSCHADCQRPSCKARRENIALRDAISQLYDMTEGYADGAPDASAHDKLCNEIAAKLQPFIQ